MKILICGNYGVSNVGDEAMLAGLKQAILINLPDAKIEVMGKGRLLPIGFRSLMRDMFVSKNPDSRTKSIQFIKSCDVFILGGGGLFTDEEYKRVPLFWALHGLFAHYICKKSVYCMGISVSPLRGLNKWIVKKLFSIAKAIVVRDKPSYELVMKEYGVLPILSSDLALFLDFQPLPIKKKSDERYIVVSLRQFPKNNENLYTKLAQFCNWAIDKYGLYIKLMPFQEGEDFDYAVLNKIFERINKKIHIAVEKFPLMSPKPESRINELIEILANAEAVIGMRLHACILSLLAETPFIPLGYMNKVKDFWGEFEEISTVELSDFTAETLKTKFKKIMENQEQIRALIKQIKLKLLERAKKTEETILSFKRDISK